jgi:hypothetical protein
LFHRLSVVSVCVKSKIVEWDRAREEIIPCFALIHHSDILPLDLRFYSTRGSV